MADAHGSGPCVRKDVGVQLPPRPPASTRIIVGRAASRDVGVVALPEARLLQAQDRPWEVPEPAGVQGPRLGAAEVEVVAEQRAEDLIAAVAVEAAVGHE